MFRHYDRAGLDAQYNLRMRHPEYQDYLDRNERESERVRRTLSCRLDVAYGPKPGERLDIFPAAGPGAPVQVFIHGGYWQLLDKESHSFIAGPFVAAGCAVVTVNYTLAPEADLGEMIRQNRSALAWVYRNARTFNGDPARIFISGHSAGGQLVAMMMAADFEAEEDVPADVIKGGCAVSGIFDLEPIRLSFLNEAMAMDEEEARRNSPLYHLPRGRAPLILAVGSGETDEFLRQTSEFSTALENAGYPFTSMVLSGLNHYAIVQELGRDESPLTQAVFRQMSLGGPENRP
jgi:arylformamidase